MPGCQAVVCNIKRHLRVHVKRGELHINDIYGHGKRKFMPYANNPEIRGKKPRTTRKKWCPVASLYDI